MPMIRVMDASGRVALAGHGVRELRHVGIARLHLLELRQDLVGLVDLLEVEGEHHHLVVVGLPVVRAPASCAWWNRPSALSNSWSRGR